MTLVSFAGVIYTQCELPWHSSCTQHSTAYTRIWMTFFHISHTWCWKGTLVSFFMSLASIFYAFLYFSFFHLLLFSYARKNSQQLKSKWIWREFAFHLYIVIVMELHAAWINVKSFLCLNISLFFIYTYIF